MSEQKLIDAFGSALDKQMAQDMSDMLTESARLNTHASNRKILPAYEEVDVFHRQQVEDKFRLEQDRATASQGRLIQPDDPTKPKVRMIMPNE